jgi:hypothetical protein
MRVIKGRKRRKIMRAQGLHDTTLVGSVSHTPQPPSTPTRQGTSSTALDASPRHRDRAFRHIVEHQTLLPRSLARARTIFRGRPELADEYLSFGDGDDEVEARREWLTMELEAVVSRTQH